MSQRTLFGATGSPKGFGPIGSRLYLFHFSFIISVYNPISFCNLINSSRFPFPCIILQISPSLLSMALKYSIFQQVCQEKRFRGQKHVDRLMNEGKLNNTRYEHAFPIRKKPYGMLSTNAVSELESRPWANWPFNRLVLLVIIFFLL
jgi:hypothetical protein